MKVLPNDIGVEKDIEKVKKEEYQFKKEDATDTNDINQYSTMTSGMGSEFSEEIEFETSFDKDNEIDSKLPDDVQETTPRTNKSPATTTTTEQVEIIIIEGEEYLTLPNSSDIILQKPSFRSTLGNLSDSDIIKKVKESLKKNASEVAGSNVPPATFNKNLNDIDKNVLGSLRLFEVEGLQPKADDSQEEEDDYDPQHFR